MDKNYITPHVSLFSKGAKQTEISAESLTGNQNRLLLVLKDFGIKGDIVNISAGPVVILYEFKPVSGIKISRIVSLANDIARCMKAMSARISPDCRT